MNWLCKIGIHDWETIKETITFPFGFIFFYSFKRDKVCMRCGKCVHGYTKYEEDLKKAQKRKELAKIMHNNCE